MELNLCVLNPAYRLIANVVDVLQCSHHTDFSHYSNKKTVCFFGVVPDDKELVGKL